MDTNKMRDQFEAAFIAQQVEAFGEYSRDGAVYRLKRDGDFAKPPTTYDLDRREQGMYDEYWIEMLWWAWQASRAAVVVELTGEYELPPTMDMQALVTSTRQQDIATIEAQGLRVAP
nr:hypothetical protein [uncultured Pseudomonas sp.]